MVLNYLFLNFPVSTSELTHWGLRKKMANTLETTQLKMCFIHEKVWILNEFFNCYQEMCLSICIYTILQHWNCIGCCNSSSSNGGGWGCEVSCGGHHRPRGKTTPGSALNGAVFDIAQILAHLVHDISRSQLYLWFGHFGWFASFFSQ